MGNTIAIVWEQTGCWAVALRRGGLPAGCRLIETRSLDACREEVRQTPRAMVVCEATEQNLPRVLRLLVELQATSPETRAMVVGARAMQRHESLLREAGAVHAVFSPRRLSTTNAMLQRNMPAPVCTTDSLEEFAWSRLPWGP
ncbi:MAG: hypothetical protein RIC55_28455 [Pirellulaceae bacterium]